MSKFKVLGKLFSKTDEALDALKRERGTGAEFLKELEKTPGVKTQEIKDRKLDKVLPSMGKTTKADVKKVLEQNPPPKLQEEVLGDLSQVKQKVTDEEIAEWYKESFGVPIERDAGPDWRTRRRDFIEDMFSPEREDIWGLSKFEDYTIPGGENYREILLKLPKTEPKLPPPENFRVVYDPGQGWVVQSNKRVVGPFAGESEAMDKMYQLAREARWVTREETEALRRESRGFESPHWDQPNVLAHARVSDRVGPNGEKILHIEEIQSDWHQKGRKEGYRSGDEAQQISALVKDYDALTARRRELLKQAEEMPGSGPEFVAAINEANDITPQLMRLQTQMDNLRSMDQRGVPDAPFKKNWHELTMKRLLNYAAENGYDRLAITPGVKQAERYDLSKQVSSVSYVDNSTLIARDMDGREVIKQVIPPEKIEDYVGKEVARKLLEQPEQKAAFADHTYRQLSGVDLQVGGEGMKGFYDKILPDYLNNYGKQYGAQIEPLQINIHKDLEGYMPLNEMQTETLHSFPITQQMRQDITQKGLPLYQQIGIPTGIGATQIEQPAEQPMEQQMPQPPFKRGGKVRFSSNPDTMRLELMSKR